MSDTIEDLKRNAWEEAHPYPTWEELKFELSNADLREIIELLILEPEAYDGLNKYIEDNYERY